MSVYVAEYLGQRTDVDTPVIEPFTSRETLCPFQNTTCFKCKKGTQPVCCVRKQDGELWIVCPNRLCSTKKDVSLHTHQIQILRQIAHMVFSPTVPDSDICVRREIPLTANDTTDYHADYIMSLRSGLSPFSGPDKLIVEMQGGGETGNTGNLTAHVKSWAAHPRRTNEMLRQPQTANTLETNAWRRQQEQFIVKGNVAMKTWKGYGIAFCVGPILYDYIMAKIDINQIPQLRNYNWTLAILTFKEDTSRPVVPGPIPLCIDPERIIYTNYQTFVHALINQGKPTLSAFRGEYTTLTNETVIIN